MEQVIIIANEENKKSILRKNSQDHHFYNLKFYSFQELKKSLFFDYDLHTILYVVDHYHVSISVAKIYLENLYFLKDLDEEKIKFLLQLKDDLDEHHLLIYSSSFKNYLLGKKIVVYDYPFLTKEQRMILDKLNVNIIYRNRETYDYQPEIYQAQNMDDEVAFVFQKISQLLEKGIALTNIKIVATSVYDQFLSRYFSFYHLPYHQHHSYSFFSTMIAQEFLDHYDEESIEENILHLSEKYQNTSQLVDIINRSVYINDKEKRKLFIVEDLKQARVKEVIYREAIEVCSLEDSFDDQDYVFLLGFNMNDYPGIQRDIDYLSDKVKEQLGLDTTIDKNEYQKQYILRRIKEITHLVITYRLNGSNGVDYPSVLIQELGVDISPVYLETKISYSKIYSEIEYAKALDQLYKFNSVDTDLAMYQNNLIIPYLQYNNQFSSLSLDLLKNHLDHHLTLSYTNLEMYQECAFRYYVSKILHLDIFEENFKTILGSVMHHVLELGIIKDIDILVEVVKFVKEKGYVLGAKEFFYLEEFSKDLEKVLAVIRNQQSHSKLNHYLFEQEFFVYKDKEDIDITFKGNIDKIMYDTVNGKEVLAVVDYKTGNANITLKNLEYGLQIQLPIYLYLLKKSERFGHSLIAGFYIQKVIRKKENIQFKKTEEENLADQLRLRGFTNSDERLMEMIDDHYENSQIIQNLKFKKNGELSQNSKVLSESQMDELILKVDQIIDQVIANILDGAFAINPKIIDGKNISCTYCHFQDLCYKSKKDEIVLGGEEDGLDNGTTAGD